MLPFARDRQCHWTRRRHDDLHERRRQNRRVEIGSTWYRKSVQRTALNTQCKLMLLAHAFEALDCIAVEFRTHAFNHQSRPSDRAPWSKARWRVAQPSIASNGTLRDTYVYSVIASEWPDCEGSSRVALNQSRQLNR